MYTINQLVIISFLLASSTLALPVNSVSSELTPRLAAAVAEASNLEVSEVPSFLDERDIELSERNVEVFALEARKDPYNGKVSKFDLSNYL